MPTLNPTRAKAELCRRSFFRFFCEFWETIEAVDLELNWHVEYICDQLQEVYEAWERGESQPDVLINVPPGSSKSTIVTQIFPAWLWVRNPSIRAISSSYAGDLATAHAVKTRDVLKSDKFLLYFPDLIKFKADSDGKTHYKNTEKGERFVTSTGGRVTGMHGDFLFIDDPLNPEEAASEAELRKAFRFVSTTLSTRKTNKKRSVTIMIMQRLHENDPAGKWIKNKPNLRWICLPGVLNDMVRPVELREKYTDGLLDTNRLDREALDKLKSDLGSYGFANQIEQLTAPENGSIWQKWFVPVPDREFPNWQLMAEYGTDWDTAYTDKGNNASSAYVVSGKVANAMYIDQIGWFNEEFPALIHEMKLLPDPHYVEAKASGKSAKQTLVSMGIPAMEVQVNGDKIARARDATPKAEAGMVFIRQSLCDKLYNDSEQGILKFPNGAKQDLADTIAQAIMRHFPNNPMKAVTGSLGQAMRGGR